MSPRQARLLLCKRDLNMAFSCRLCGAPYDSRLEACPECGRRRNLCSYLSIPPERSPIRARARSNATATTRWSLSVVALSMVALAAVKIAQASSNRPLSGGRTSISATANVIEAGPIAEPEPSHRSDAHNHKSRGWPRLSRHSHLRAASSIPARHALDSSAIAGAAGGL